MKTRFKDFLKDYLIPAIVVAAALVAVYLLLGTKIWENFLPNFLATMLGAIVGIPIAIGINDQQAAKKEKLQKEKIIPILREELLGNLIQLSSWQKSNSQKLETIYTSIFLEDSAWATFSDSGELAFIKDVKLLQKISHAYSTIRSVKLISERFIELVHLPDQKERELLQTPVSYLLSRGIDMAIEDVSIALKSL